MILDSHSRRRTKEKDTNENDTRAPLIARLRRAAKLLATPDDLDPLLDAIGDARFVLLKVSPSSRSKVTGQTATV